MELFKFITVTDPTVFIQGRMINGARSIMWTERYREAGEFEIVGKLSSGLREFLPIGTFISHADTLEVMVVENHEIADQDREDSEIIITGRSLEVLLEQRIVGMNMFRSSSWVGFYGDYTLNPNYTWHQIAALINDHIGNATYTDDNLVNIIATASVTETGVSEARVVKSDVLYKTVLDLLEIDDLGIKIIRRNTFGAPDGSNTQTRICVHKGIDKSASVIFSWKSGDIQSAEYLWSDRKRKNSCVVLGRSVVAVVDAPGVTKANRRTMIVDGTDLDEHVPQFPSGTEFEQTHSKMVSRAQLVLTAQKLITITRTDLSQVTKYKYRRDFNVGDLVSIDGNFGQIAIMRISEYVEIQDENGESEHPTLSVPGG
jgi:hypothetical protein